MAYAKSTFQTCTSARKNYPLQWKTPRHFSLNCSSSGHPLSTQARDAPPCTLPLTCSSPLQGCGLQLPIHQSRRFLPSQRCLVIPTGVPRRVPQVRFSTWVLGLPFPVPQVRFSTWVLGLPFPVPQVRFSTWVLGLPFPVLSSQPKQRRICRCEVE